MKSSSRHTCAPFLLDEAGAQIIFAPFCHSDSKVSNSFPAQLETLSGTNCQLKTFWDATHICWDSCAPGAVSCRFNWSQSEDCTGYDELIICMDTGTDVTARVKVVYGSQQPEWHEMDTKGERGELFIPLTSNRIDAILIELIPRTKAPCRVTLRWFGLSNHKKAEEQSQPVYAYDSDWPGLINPDVDWEHPVFARNLLFESSLIPQLREKKLQPGWDEIFTRMEHRAAKWMHRCPEDEISKFIPWSDGRYMRRDQVREEMFFFGPLTLAVVGMVNQDQKMMKLAVRFLMAYLHTTHWCPAENRIIGSTWNSKCFQEELAVTHVALLADWFDFALTRHAKELVRTCIWDKGLAVIEKDLMKYAYMWDINQGPWFCRARILGGLMLENKWPCTGDYVDRAYHEMIKMMEHYILPDGGSDEGLSYFGLTINAVLKGILAYARARKLDPMELMPRNFEKVAHYIATMTGVKAGTMLTEGDASTPRIPGNGMAILAGLLPGSTYEKIYAGSMEDNVLGNYMKQYIEYTELGFVLGPQKYTAASCVVPTFSILPCSGHLTSCRRNAGHIFRLHLTGAKAGANHTHYDKGGIILEVDDQPVLIDRGVVRYDDNRSGIMNRSNLHNVITPVKTDGSFPDQARVLEAQIPDGSGDELKLSAQIDISHVWRDHMISCSRSIISDNPKNFKITDRGELKTKEKIAFHLQSRQPFVIGENCVTIDFTGGQLLIEAPWAEQVEQGLDCIDLSFRDIYHAVWYSSEVTAFELTTKLTIST